MNRKKNILILASHLWIGGAEVVIANLARHLDSAKFNVIICHLQERGSIGDQLLEEGIQIIGISDSKIRTKNYFSFLKLNKIIKKYDIDILHSHTTYTLIDATLCKIINPKVKLIHTFHFGNYPNIKKKYLFMERFASMFCDKVVAVGNEQKDKINKLFHIREKKWIKIWNGVSEVKKKEVVKSASMYMNGRIIIGTTSTLITQKGLNTLLDVAFRMKEINALVLFLIAGEGGLRKELELRRAELKLENEVIFLGWVDDAANSFLPYIDIFFLPSLWEAMSVAVLEAMAAGKPIVCTTVGENEHVIDDGENGFLVPPRDTDAMVSKLYDLVKSGSKREYIGKAARKKYYDQFTVQHMINKYENLYENVT